MKKQDLSNFKSKSVAELEAVIAEVRLQINKAQMDFVSHRLKNTNTVKNLKRSLAQALTFKKEKTINNPN